jgi:nucleoid-associated protein YgaU
MGNGSYTVQPRDVAGGLMGIASRYYDDPACWQRIYEANRAVIGNDPRLLRAGQQLVLPGLIPEGRADAAPHLYAVGPRDLVGGLRGVAARLWGDPERWGELYALNRGVLGDDPDALVPGQWLILP